MTRQFYVYTLEALMMLLLDMVDSSFSNSLGKDEIVAFSSFVVLTWVVSVATEVGSVIYDMWQGNTGTCMLISLIFCVLLGVSGFVFADRIVRVYTLTEVQYGMVSRLFRVRMLFIATFSLVQFMNEYCLIKCKIKQAVIGNVLHYSVVIGLDAVVVYLGADIECGLRQGLL